MQIVKKQRKNKKLCKKVISVVDAFPILVRVNAVFRSCLFVNNSYNKLINTCLFTFFCMTNRHPDLGVKLNSACRFCATLTSAADSVLCYKFIFLVTSVSVSPDPVESPQVLAGCGVYYSKATGTA